MMAQSLRTGINKGVVLGIILIFLVLIAFTTVIAAVIAKVIITQTTSIINLVIFTGLLAFFIGWSTVKSEDQSWTQSLVSGLAAGLSAGLVVGIFSYLLGKLYADGGDLRSYLSALSPETVRYWLLYRSPQNGAVSHFIILLAATTFGALLRTAWLRFRVRDRFHPRSGLANNPVARILRGNEPLRWIMLALLVGILLLLPQLISSYWNYILGTVGIYILLGLGLNLIVGLSGQLVLGYVAFFGIGAYGFALLTAPVPHNLLLNFWIALLAGAVLAAVSGILIGVPIMRLRGDYLAIVTLGFGEMTRILIRSDILTPLTAGPRGVRDLAQPVIFGQSFASEADFMYLIIAFVLLLIFVTSRLTQSKIGRAWVAIREDELVAQASGVDVVKYKLLALAIGGLFAGIAGALFASRNQFTGPEDHVLMVSINVLSLVIVGGMGSIPGVILGAFALKGLPEILRDLESYRMLVFGGLLVVMMILRPEGLWPSQRPTMEKAEVVEDTPPPGEQAAALEVHP